MQQWPHSKRVYLGPFARFKADPLGRTQTLTTIAENLLREPDNLKYQQFKPTNDLIKRRLVDTKGTLEYAVAVSDMLPPHSNDRIDHRRVKLGFRPVVCCV